MFLTVHDVGSSYVSWAHWVMDTSMEEVRKRSASICILVFATLDTAGHYSSMFAYLVRSQEQRIFREILLFLP